MTMINVKNKLGQAKAIATSDKAFAWYLMGALGLGGYKLYTSVLSVSSVKSTKKEYQNLTEKTFDAVANKHLDDIDDQLDYLENALSDIEEEVNAMSSQDENVPEDEPDDPEPTPDAYVDERIVSKEDTEAYDEEEDEEPEVIPVIRKKFWNRQNLRELRILIKRDNMDLVTLKDHFGIPITTIKLGIKELKEKGKLHSEFQIPFQNEKKKEEEVDVNAVQNSTASQPANS